MKQDNITIDYQIVLNDALSDGEVERLRERERVHEMKDVTYNGCIIKMRSGLDEREILSAIAVWMSYIGAEGDIFCVQQVKSMYTGFTSPAVKDLLRTE